MVGDLVALGVWSVFGGGEGFVSEKVGVEADEDVVVVEEGQGFFEGCAWGEGGDVVEGCGGGEDWVAVRTGYGVLGYLEANMTLL